MLVSNLNVKSNFRINRSISILNGKPKNVKTAPNPFSFHFLLENAEGSRGSKCAISILIGIFHFLMENNSQGGKNNTLLTG